jgi:hypothetical protein
MGRDNEQVHDHNLAHVRARSILFDLKGWRHNTSNRGMGCASVTEAFPWNEAPHYMIRNRDRI